MQFAIRLANVSTQVNGHTEAAWGAPKNKLVRFQYAIQKYKQVVSLVFGENNL
jgi:hypothetical protein